MLIFDIIIIIIRKWLVRTHITASLHKDVMGEIIFDSVWFSLTHYLNIVSKYAKSKWAEFT